MDKGTKRNALDILDSARDSLRRVGADNLADMLCSLIQDETERECGQCTGVGRNRCLGCPMYAMRLQSALTGGEEAETTDKTEALWDVWERTGGIHKILSRAIAQADADGDTEGALRLCRIGATYGEAEGPLEHEILLSEGIWPAESEEEREKQMMQLLAKDGGPLRRPLGWES